MRWSVLLNWLYYPPVGHAVEGFAAAAEYHAVDPDLEIHLLLNSRTPVELGDCCPWIARTYAIDVDAFVASPASDAACLRTLPRAFDYVVSSERLVYNLPSYSAPLLRCHERIDDHVEARLWRGVRGQEGTGRAAPLPFRPSRRKPRRPSREALHA